MSRGGGEGEGRRAPPPATGSEREREAASIWIGEREREAAGGRKGGEVSEVGFCAVGAVGALRKEAGDGKEVAALGGREAIGGGGWVLGERGREIWME